MSETVLVPMRDGIRLATDIYLPAEGSAFPVVLERTPYGRHLTSRSEITAADREPISRAELAACFTAHGYAVVFQDTRGRYGSEGRFVKYLSDAEDGYDTCAWLQGQSWCDGRICTMGLSYAAHTQAALGCLDAPGVMAQVLDCGGFSNAWRSGIRQSGAFELKQATWAFRNAIASPEANADPIMKAALSRKASPTGSLGCRGSLGTRRCGIIRITRPICSISGGTAPSTTTGKRRGFSPKAGTTATAKPRACIYRPGTDPYTLTAATNYTGLRDAGRGPQRLILGPWTHGDRSDRVIGDVDFGPDAPLDSWAGDWRAYRLRFFNHVLRGASFAEPRVRVFVMGGGSGRRTPSGHFDHGGRWVSADDWPLPGTRFQPFHLHADGRLDPAAPSGDVPR